MEVELMSDGGLSAVWLIVGSKVPQGPRKQPWWKTYRTCCWGSTVGMATTDTSGNSNIRVRTSPEEAKLVPGRILGMGRRLSWDRKARVLRMKKEGRAVDLAGWRTERQVRVLTLSVLFHFLFFLLFFFIDAPSAFIGLYSFTISVWSCG